MPTSDFYSDCDKALASRIPILGASKARAAVQKLTEHRDEPAAQSRLLAATEHPDEKTREAAAKALRTLPKPSAGVDALCAAWANSRNPLLGQIIEECGYIAQQPLDVWALSALQAGSRPEATRADVVQILVGVLADKDAKLRNGAEDTLKKLPTGEGMDALCALAVRDPKSVAARICVEQGYRPGDPEDDALFLLVTGQVEEYFLEDDNFHLLRAAYSRADAAVQARVMTAARAGDARLLPFVLVPRFSRKECPPEELDEAVASCIRRQDWTRLFSDCRTLPLRHTLPGWQALATSRWQPQDSAECSMLEQITADLKGQTTAQPPPQAPAGTSAVFEKWLTAGRVPEMTKLSEAELVNRLRAATPPDAVPLVSALSALSAVSDATRTLVRDSEHWLVRLAGLITGLTKTLATDPDMKNENVMWVRELAGASGVWSFWPTDATPRHLEDLAAAPPEAWLGETGRARRILRAIIAHSTHAGAYEEDMISPDEGAIEITEITD